MAWIKLDDQIAQHPKFLKAGNSAWMWVACVGYSQRYLTDGFVPTEAIASLIGGIRKPQSYVKKLIKCRLLEKVKGGYQVHDYLQHNASAALVRQKREADRVRKESERNPRGVQPDSARNPEVVLARAPAIPSHPIPLKKEQEQKSSGSATTAALRRTDAADRTRVLHPKQNIKVITKLVHTVLERPDPPTAFADIKFDVEELCAKQHILRDSVVVGEAIESALVQRQRKRAPVRS